MQEDKFIECEALNILANTQKLKKLTSQSSIFIDKFVKNPRLLIDMLDIALRPTFFQKSKELILTNNFPALAINTLTNLYQGLIDLLAFDRILPNNRQLEGLQLEQLQNEIQPIQNIPIKQEFKYLLYIHLNIIENQPQQAAYFNLNRLIGPLTYQRPVQLMIFYHQKPQVMRNIILKMNKKGIIQIFCKILEAESGRQFFRDYKQRYLIQYYAKLIQMIQQKDFEDWLSGLHTLYCHFTLKMQEKCDLKKYLSLLQKIREAEFNLLKAINHKNLDITDNSLLFCLKWIQQLLKHDNYIIGQNNVRLSITFLNRKNSISNNFYDDDKIELQKAYHISENMLKEIIKFCQFILKKFLSKIESYSLQNQILISLYRIFYFFVRIWSSKQKEKQIKHSNLIFDLINQNTLDGTLIAVIKNSSSTIFHNMVKQFLVESIHQKIINPQYFYNQDKGYIKLFLQYYPKNRQNIAKPFSQQLYYIYKEVIAIKPHVSTEVENLIKEQDKRLGKTIGYDPRSLHADTLRGSSNAISQSSENFDDFLQFQLYSSHNTLGVPSGRSFGLGVVKVHNMTSIQRTELQQVGEQRIVIQGVGQDDD